jgi:ATP-dependent helicase HrpB
MRERLPVYEIEPQIVAPLKESRRLILQAPTGSGKSTQVPQMLLEHGFLDQGQNPASGQVGLGEVRVFVDPAG